MSILSFDKPTKIRSTDEHHKTFSSDSGVSGTYVPNMSRADMYKWKAKKIGGDDPRVEIRKTVQGTEPNGRGTSTQLLVIVRANTVTISANGRMVFGWETWSEIHGAIDEATEALKG